MTATKRISDCRGYSAGWELQVGGKPVPRDQDWEAVSPFGRVSSAVVVDSQGNPVFDRPMYEEAPNVNIVAYGYDADGEVRIAVIRQPRPHADDPRQPGVNNHAPVVFGQIPMGFLEKLLGESPEDAARRETGEETGASTVIKVTQPACPWHNPNPTFVKTWSDLYFVQVDLAKVEELKPDRNEPIYSAEYVTVPELLGRICDGVDDRGAVYRMCTANSILMIFFATYPELF